MSRTVYLVILAMIMAAAGIAVVILARTTPVFILGGVCIVGALAVVLANVNGRR